MNERYEIEKYADRHKQRMLWRYMVSGVAVVMVLGILYALILTAITMERDEYACGLPEHTHDAGCYNVVCGMEEVIEHSHTDACYDSEGNVVCGLPEFHGHTHSDACYSTPEPVCGNTEEDHQHTEECYPADFVPELICGLEETRYHTHTDACRKLVCGMVEHTHDDSCTAPTEDTTQPTDATDATDATDVTDATDATDATEATDATQATEPIKLEIVTPSDSFTNEKVPEQNRNDILLGGAPLGGGQPSPANAADGQPVRLVDVQGGTVNIEGTQVNYNPETKTYTASLALDFTLPTKGELGSCYIPDQNGADAGSVFTFGLGDLKVSDDLLNKDFPLREGYINWGTYRFEKVNDKVIVKVELDKSKIDYAETGIKGQINFSGSLGNDKTDSSGNITMGFEGNASLVIQGEHIKYPPGTSADGEVYVSKSGSYSQDGKTLTYRVEVTTKNGTPGVIDLKDTLHTSGLPIGNLQSVKVDNQTLNPTPTVTNGEGTKTFNLQLSKLDAGQKHVIEYTYALTGDPTQNTQVGNTVHAESKKDNGVPPIKVDKDNNVWVTPPSGGGGETTPPGGGETTPPGGGGGEGGGTSGTPNLWKNSWYNQNSSDTMNQTRIPWSVGVNDNHVDIAGKTLTDPMMTKTQILNPPGLVVKVDGQQTADYSQYLTISDDGTVTFKQLSGGTNTHKYEFIYYTAAGELGSWAGGSVTNTVTLGDKHAETTVTNHPGSVDKSNDGAKYNSDGTKVKTSWTVKVNVGNDGMPPQYVLSDSTVVDGSEVHYFDQGTIRLRYDNGGYVPSNCYSVKFYDKQGDGKQEVTEDATYMEITILKNPFDSTIPAVNGSRQLQIAYTTVADAPSSAGSVTYHNKVWYRDKDKESTATVTTKDSHTEKYSIINDQWSDHATTSGNAEGKLDWVVKVTTGVPSNAQTITVVDTLPDHVSVLKLEGQAHPNGGNYKTATLTVDGSGNITGSTDKYTFSGTCVKNDGDDHYTVTVNITKTDGGTLDADTEFFVKYYCQIDEDYRNENYGTGTFSNSAVVRDDNGVIGTPSQETTWYIPKKDPGEGSLKKGGKWNGDFQEMQYSLVINPEGKDLQANSNKLILTDTFEYNAQKGSLDLVYELVQDSVKLYYGVPQGDGTVTKGDPYGAVRWVQETEDTSTFDNKVKKILKVEVPDSTCLILEYSYMLASYNPSKQDFDLNAKNHAVLNGVVGSDSGSDHTGEDWTASSTTGSITSGHAYSITKVQEGNSSITIDNVEFSIYKLVETSKDTWEWQPATITNNQSISKSKYTTAFGGHITVRGDDGYDTNVLYKLVETKSPADYVLPENAPELLFYFSDESNTEVDLPPKYLLFNAVDLTKGPQSAYVTNTPSVLDFGVDKLWLDSNGNNVTSQQTSEVQFELVQVPQQERDLDGTLNDPLLGSATVHVYLWRGHQNDGTAEEKVYKVPKGTVFTFTLNRPAGQDPVTATWLPGEGNNLYSHAQPLHPTMTGGNVYRYVANYDINVGFLAHANSDQYDNVSLDVAVSSNGAPPPSAPLDQEYLQPKLYNTYTLSAANNWHWSSKDHNIPSSGIVTDAEQVEHHVWYTYYVREVTTGNYTTTYSNVDGAGNVISISTGTINVTNQLPEAPPDTSITVNKQWLNRDGGTASPGAESVHVTLYKAVAGSVVGAFDPSMGQKVDEADLNEANNWTHLFAHLPIADESGILWYYVVEDPVEDYETGYIGNGVGGGTITVTNTNDEPIPTKIQVQKVWEGLGEGTQTEIRFRLFRKEWDHKPTEEELAGAPHGVTYDSVAFPENITEVTKSGVDHFAAKKDAQWLWDSDTEGLELKSYSDGKWYSYFIVEQPGGYTITYSPNRDVTSGTITVTNDVTGQPTEILVHKEWHDPAGGVLSGKTGTVQFDLYRIATPVDSGGSTDPSEPVDPSEPGGDTDPSEPGTTDPSGPGTTDPSKPDESEPEKPPVEPTGYTVNVIIANYNQNFSTPIYQTSFTSVTAGSVVTITMTGMTDGYYSIEPKYWPTGLNNGYYDTSFAAPAVTDNVIKVTVNGDITIGVLTNDSTNNITGSATLTPPAASRMRRNVLRLSATTPTGGKFIGTYELSDSTGWNWSSVKEKLDLKASEIVDGVQVNYTYYIVEHPDASYSIAYDNNDGITSGTITVINTLSEFPGYTLPDTGGIGTGGYTLAGLIVTIGAALALAYRDYRRRRCCH